MPAPRPNPLAFSSCSSLVLPAHIDPVLVVVVLVLVVVVLVLVVVVPVSDPVVVLVVSVDVADVEVVLVVDPLAPPLPPVPASLGGELRVMRASPMATTVCLPGWQASAPSYW
jgi:hypothetical protein